MPEAVCKFLPTSTGKQEYQGQTGDFDPKLVAGLPPSKRGDVRGTRPERRQNDTKTQPFKICPRQATAILVSVVCGGTIGHHPTENYSRGVQTFNAHLLGAVGETLQQGTGVLTRLLRALPAESKSGYAQIPDQVAPPEEKRRTDKGARSVYLRRPFTREPGKLKRCEGEEGVSRSAVVVL